MSDLIRYKAVVAYDGTDFTGYQRQSDPFRTVQGELEKAISHLAKRPITVRAAGRTDSGVHATGQVISFDINWKHGNEKLLLAINTMLPEDVAISTVAETFPDFNPRFGARSRTYRYFIERCDAKARRPLTRYRKWQIFQPLDMSQMQQAASMLVGEHDFATFGTPPQGNNTVRQLFRAEWQARGDDLIFEIEGTAFLYRMVRSIVGSIKMVGTGQWLLSDFIAAFEAKSRDACAGAAPAHGLYLVSVKYEDE